MNTINAPQQQRHLLAFWDELDVAGRRRLQEQIADVDLDLVERLYHGHEVAPDWASLAQRAESPPAFRLRPSGEERFSHDEAVARGRQALAEGRIGAVLVAGGQGTRLGFEHPKGMYPAGPVSQRTLFQIFVDRLLAVGRRYNARIPLYLMTSPATDAETIAYFAAHDRLGMPVDDLTIFCQGTMPAVDAETGKVLLSAKDSIALSPDGHGGTLTALAKHGCLKDCRRRGIEQLFYFQVDNPLTQVCDPAFIGYHLLCESEVSTQVIAKHEPGERLGVLATIDGKVQIIEYSDLPPADAARRAADGSLALWAGNTAVHVFDVDFLERVRHQADALPYHRAHKKVSYVDSAGDVVEPQAPNAIKFERFI
ncbi:MAG: UTP--glucose-1-phosphate uridylyltransferase, partial [Planctomycetales bacterium]|nr:UTP--glucose-1-phosphate uridylyltransferase [Planctomycetales bacterium]